MFLKTLNSCRAGVHGANRLLGWLIVLLMVCCSAPAFAAQGKHSKNGGVPGADLFTNGPIPRLQIEMGKEQLEALRRSPRQTIYATVKEGTNEYAHVGMHLKGAAGSFRDVDNKPGLVLHFGDTKNKQLFHGLRKIILNNSVQDPTYFNEALCADLFRAAGVPAPRVTHALVELNGRKLGFYVVKEGFNKDFFGMWFKSTDGNQYDISQGNDVTEHMKRDGGVGPSDWSDLKAVADAALEPDAKKRWDKLRESLEVDRFVSFMAVEMLVCHWDGYCRARNNFRIYHDMDTGKMVFLPNDLDQTFQDPNFPVYAGMNGVVAQAIMRTPEGQRMFRERVEYLSSHAFNVLKLTNRVNQLADQIRPALATLSPSGAKGCDIHADLVRGRIVARAEGLRSQVGVPVIKDLKFTNGMAQLTGWREQVDEAGSVKLDKAKDATGKNTLHIQALGNTFSSWRTRVRLDAGRYCFSAMARTTGVKPIRDEQGEGAGLRISGAEEPRDNGLKGDKDWTRLQYKFAVDSPGDDISLVCEIRALKGDVWFDADSLKLERLK